MARPTSFLHIARERLPLALARRHRSLAVGAPFHASFPRWDASEGQPDPLGAVVEGAGFAIDRVDVDDGWIHIAATRRRTLPDFVGPRMRVLVCGLNPSVVAADAGYGYASPSNRFWRAAVDAGLVSRPRDPWHALAAHRVGMTDLVKRATPRSSEVTPAEYRAGAARVRWLVEWLRPRLVLFVGLEGWRHAVDRKARPGVQPTTFGGAPTYVMPSSSGLNAHATPADVAAHMRAALDLLSDGGR